ncbi:MAG: hypothetical protein K0S11_107 [Gammaproteobacteria bacterium]|jgi:hypothetical protein|nr:hypothetical protein [Gammaproteobacteria bacterium]
MLEQTLAPAVQQQKNNSSDTGADSKLTNSETADSHTAGLAASQKISAKMPSAIHQIAKQGVMGSGEHLPYYEQIQASFGVYDISDVSAYTDPEAAAASHALGATAYATGNKIAFASSNPDLFTVAHEAAHVVQQRIGVDLSNGIGLPGDLYERHADDVAAAVTRGDSAEALLDELNQAKGIQGALNSAWSKGVAPHKASPTYNYKPDGATVQLLNRKFRAPDRMAATDLGTPVNINYPGHNVALPGGFATTNACNGPANIITAGENAANVASDPATPNNMLRYSKNAAGAKVWSRQGGLLNDPSIGKNQAVTKMHALNHHLDPAALNDPVQENIFLGTKKSNNPSHLHKVEKPVQNSILKNYKSLPGNRAQYEADMAIAGIQQTQDATTNEDVLYWPEVAAGVIPVSNKAVKHAQLYRVAADNTHYAAGVVPHPGAAPAAAAAIPPGGTVANEIGYALVQDDDTIKNNYYHAWIDYTVTPNYKGLPDYIIDNIEEELDDLATLVTAPVVTDIANALGGLPQVLAEVLRTLTLPVPVVDIAHILTSASATPAVAAQIVNGLGDLAAASVLVHVPAATVAPILDAVAGVNLALAGNVLGHMPNNNHTADIVGNLNPAAAAQLLNAMLPAAPANAAAILQLIPTALAVPIVNAVAGLSAANAASIIAALPTNNHQAEMLGSMNNVDAAAIVHGMGAGAVVVLQLIPLANLLAILSALAAIGGGINTLAAILTALPGPLAVTVHAGLPGGVQLALTGIGFVAPAVAGGALPAALPNAMPAALPNAAPAGFPGAAPGMTAIADAAQILQTINQEAAADILSDYSAGDARQILIAAAGNLDPSLTLMSADRIAELIADEATANVANAAGLTNNLGARAPEMLTTMVALGHDNHAANIAANIPAANAAAILDAINNAEVIQIIQLLPTAQAALILDALTPLDSYDATQVLLGIAAGHAADYLAAMNINVAAQLMVDLPYNAGTAGMVLVLDLLPMANIQPIFHALVTNHSAARAAMLMNELTADGLKAEILAAMHAAVPADAAAILNRGAIGLFTNVENIMVELTATVAASLLDNLMGVSIASARSVIEEMLAAMAAEATDIIGTMQPALAGELLLELTHIAAIGPILIQLPVAHAGAIFNQLLVTSVANTLSVFNAIPNNNYKADIIGGIVPADAVQIIDGSTAAAIAPVLQLLPPAAAGNLIGTLMLTNVVHGTNILNQMSAVAPPGGIVAALTALPVDLGGPLFNHLITANLANANALFTGFANDNYRADLLAHVIPANAAQLLASNPAANMLTILQLMPAANLLPIASSLIVLNAAVLVAILALDPSLGLTVYNGVTPVEQAALTGSGFVMPPPVVAPLIVAALPGVFPTAAALGMFPPAAPGVAPAALPGNLPVALPTVAPAALPGVAPAMLPAMPALPVVAPAGIAPAAAVGAGLANTIDNVFTAVHAAAPPQKLIKALTTLPPASAANLKAALPVATSAIVKKRLRRMADFPGWAKEALPNNFKAEAKYYTASYKTPDIYYELYESEHYQVDIV